MRLQPLAFQPPAAITVQSAMSVQVPESLKLGHEISTQDKNLAAFSLITNIFKRTMYIGTELMINFYEHKTVLRLKPCLPEETFSIWVGGQVIWS